MLHCPTVNKLNLAPPWFASPTVELRFFALLLVGSIQLRSQLDAAEAQSVDDRVLMSELHEKLTQPWPENMLSMLTASSVGIPRRDLQLGTAPPKPQSVVWMTFLCAACVCTHVPRRGELIVVDACYETGVKAGGARHYVNAFVPNRMDGCWREHRKLLPKSTAKQRLT